MNAQNASTLHVTSCPFENYGFMIWTDESGDADYFRIEVRELNWESGDTLNSIVKRFEIWDKCYAKVPNAYLRAPDPFKQYQLVLSGFDSNHNPVAEVQAKLDGPSATKDCFWDCESSEFAYRIQQYDIPQGGWSFRFEKAFQTEDEELHVKIPYFRWFSPTQFTTHTSSGNYGVK
jgi:hypothetical protein